MIIIDRKYDREFPPNGEKGAGESGQPPWRRWVILFIPHYQS